MSTILSAPLLDTQRESDYASFTPDTLGGPGLDGLGLWADDRRLSAAALSQALTHVQGVLVAAGREKEAFAVQAVLEHVSRPKRQKKCPLVSHSRAPRTVFSSSCAPRFWQQGCPSYQQRKIVYGLDLSQSRSCQDYTAEERTAVKYERFQL